MNSRKIGLYGKTGRPIVDLLVRFLRDRGEDFEQLNGNLFTVDQFDKRFDVVITDGLRGRFGDVRDTYSKKGVPVVVADSPHFRIEGYYRLSLNSHDWAPPVSGWGGRLRRLSGGVERFEGRGNEILILGQVSRDSQHGKDENALRDFYQEVVEDLYKMSDRPLTWRAHPEYQMDLGGACRVSDPSRESLRDALERAWACVTYNSTAGVTALLAGVPVFSFGASPYRSLSSNRLKDIDTAERPDEAETIKALAPVAYTQWNEEEILSGRALDFVFSCLDGIIPKVDDDEDGRKFINELPEETPVPAPPAPPVTLPKKRATRTKAKPTARKATRTNRKAN